MKRICCLLLLASAVCTLAAPPPLVRFASYNVSFFRTASGALVSEMATPNGTSANHTRIRKVAEVLQRVRPDVLLLNEFDYDEEGQALTLFAENFLAVPQQSGLEPLSYPYQYAAPSNTGISSGLDLDNNGSVVSVPGSEAYGNDSFGFGTFPGQYGMAVCSRFPIDPAMVRSFQRFRWRDMPGSLLQQNAGNPPLTTYYSAAEREALRLSSKTHLDVPVDLGNGIMAHFLVSHPTPPSFDGPENRNGKRNYDEIRLWADYADPTRAAYLYDDDGAEGGLPAGARFVVAGDLNADPNDGDSFPGAARQLTQHPLVNGTFIPSGGVSGGGAALGAASGHRGNPVHDTAAFAGGLRVDYVLPSRAGFSVFDGAVFWPGPADPLRSLVGNTDPSDHHLVWMDLRPQISLEEAVGGFAASLSGNAASGEPEVTLSWRAATGYQYAVQQADTLFADSWHAGGAAPVVTGNGPAVVKLPLGTGNRRFFRLEVSFAP